MGHKWTWLTYSITSSAVCTGNAFAELIINSCLVGACTGGRRVSHLNDDLQYDNDQHTAALQPEIKRFIRQVFAGLSYRRAP
jgi:hypothetical protein